jgi:hypothetical protein
MKRGGTVIGEGADGVVHDTTLPCKDPRKTPAGDWVTKVLRPGRTPAASLPGSVRDKLTALDIGIFPVSVCEGPTGEFQLYMKYGGLALTDQGYPDTPETPAAVRKALLDLLEKVRAMNAQGVYHNDISFDNVLYSPETGIAYLIDFERMTSNGPLPWPARKGDSERMRRRRARAAEVGPDILALEDMLADIRV